MEWHKITCKNGNMKGKRRFINKTINCDHCMYDEQLKNIVCIIKIESEWKEGYMSLPGGIYINIEKINDNVINYLIEIRDNKIREVFNQ